MQTSNRVLVVAAAAAAAAVATALITSAHLSAQPVRRSPHENVVANIDGATLTIIYGRPYMRGRVIMGGLVPYGRVWYPGADEATTLVTTRGLQMGGLNLAAGRYTLWMLPSADIWRLIVNGETGQFHTRYDARRDLGRLNLDKRTLTKDVPVEQLTFSIDQRPGGGGVIRMRWERTEVSAPFRVVP